MRRFWFIRVLCVLCVFCVSWAQDYFGKNKVQYERLSFHKKETPHFLIYYPEGGERIAAFACGVVEEQAEWLEKGLRVKKRDKTPIILYNSFHQFQQTNVILDLIEEGVGGFAEFLKRRVVVPFEGDLLVLERVLRHEVSHIYEYEVLFRRPFGFFQASPRIPVFIIEGFAEWSAARFLGMDDFSEVFLRDYIVNNKFSLADLAKQESYLSYRLGEAFFFFVERTYGEEKVFEFLHNLKRKGFSEGVFATFGKSAARFGEDFLEDLRVRYFPLYHLRLRDTLLNLLTHSPKWVYNTTPVISPKGDKIIFLSNVGGDFFLYLIDTHSGRVKKRVVRFRGAKEEVRFLRRTITLTETPEERIALFLTRGGKRELRILRGDFKLEKRIFLSLDDCFEPQFSPDGQEVLFVGIKDCFSDLYKVSLTTGEMERLTATWENEFSPSWTPSGETILFARRKDNKRMEICGYVTKDKTILRLAGDFPTVRDPILLPSGELLFLGAGKQIFLFSDGKLFRTDFFSGFDYLSISQDGRIGFSYFKNSSYEIGVAELGKIRETMQAVELVAPESESLSEVEEKEEERGKPIGFSLSADYAQGALSWTSGFFSGYAFLALSDVLGDHRFFLLTDLTGVIDFSNFYLSYWYLRERMDYNFTIYQFTYGYEVSDRVEIRRERGLSPAISYPFNKEERIETGIGLESFNTWVYDIDHLRLIDFRADWEMPYFLSYVFDNTVWQITGPRKGTRARVSGQVSFYPRNYYMGYYDFRHYFNFLSDYTFAFRLLGIGSFGKEPYSFYIDGEVCRGYEYYEFVDTTGPFLQATQLEFRFPLIREMRLGLPPLSLRDIGGRVFLDGCYLWKGSDNWWQGNSWFVKFGFGFGINIYLPPLPIRVDFSYPLSQAQEKRWRITLFLGEEF